MRPKTSSFSIMFCIFVLLSFTRPLYAQNQTRFALLIGNQSYALSVNPLKNPKNDVTRIKNSLRSIGFNVETLIDQDRAQIRGAIRDHASKLNQAGPGAVGIFYYAGHGVAKYGTTENFIIPIDIKDMSDKYVWERSVEINEIKRILKETAPFSIHFIVLDACRSELILPTRVPGKGFATFNDASGVYIAMSTESGATAEDWPTRENGPYAIAFSEEIIKPFISHIDFFQRVRERVSSLTDGKQKPTEVGGLVERVYFSERPKQASSEYDQLVEEAAHVWKFVEAATDRDVLLSFIERYKLTPFAEPARKRLSSLESKVPPPKMAPTNLPLQPLALSIVSNLPIYRRGDSVRIEVAPAKGVDLSAHAVFTMDGQPRRVDAKFDPAKSVWTINYQIPQTLNSGLYDIPVFIKDNASDRSEKKNVRIQIGLSRAEWAAAYTNPAPGLSGGIAYKGRYGVVVASPEDDLAEATLRKLCRSFKDVNFAMYTSVKPDGSNSRYQIEIGYNLSKSDATLLKQFSASSGIARDAYIFRYGWDSRADLYRGCSPVD